MVERLPRLLHLVADDLAIQPHGFDSHLGIVSLGAWFAPLSATYWLQSRAASAAHRTVFFGARPRMDPGTCAKTSSRCFLKHDNVAFKEHLGIPAGGTACTRTVPLEYTPSAHAGCQPVRDRRS